MKRYENFNELFKDNKTAEIQSFDMIIEEIANEHNINLDYCRAKHEGQIKWLNEEVGEGVRPRR